MIKRTEELAADVYVGTAEELAAAGLARPEHFPGQPGSGKHMATWVNGQRTNMGAQKDGKAAGRVTIRRKGRLFEISVTVAKEVRDARRAASQARSAAANGEMLRQEAMRRAVPHDVPIDSALMLNVMTKSGRHWGDKYGEAFAVFMIDTLAQQSPKQQPLPEGPRRSGEAAA